MITTFTLADGTNPQVAGHLRVFVDNGDMELFTAVKRVDQVDAMLNHYEWTRVTAWVDGTATVVRTPAPSWVVAIQDGDFDDTTLIGPFADRAEAQQRADALTVPEFGAIEVLPMAVPMPLLTD